jgi:flagellar basal body-associated protein FliL
VSLLFGQSFLDYSALPFGGMATPDKRSLGILLIEVGVTLAVAGGLVSIYYSLNRDIRNDDEKQHEKQSPETGDFG